MIMNIPMQTSVFLTNRLIISLLFIRVFIEETNLVVKLPYKLIHKKEW